MTNPEQDNSSPTPKEEEPKVLTRAERGRLKRRLFEGKNSPLKENPPLIPNRLNHPDPKPTLAEFPLKDMNDAETHHWVRHPNGKNIWAPKGTNPDSFPHSEYPYSEVTCRHVLDGVMQGKSISKICEEPGMPNRGTIYHWLQDHPEFQEKLKYARQVRAAYFEDKLIELATSEDISEDQVAAKRLLKDTLQLVAKYGDRNMYGDNLKVSGDPDAPISFVVETGIRRLGDPGYEDSDPPIPAESKEVK